MSYEPGTSYPYVVKTSDPLLIRFDKLSLLVGNSSFTVELKKGGYFTGFEVRVSGIGTPVYRQAVSGLGVRTVGNTTVNMTKDYQIEDLEKSACEWLDSLETAIAEKTTTDALATAINNLCYQLHYDLTKTAQEFPEGAIVDKSATTLLDMTTGMTTSITGVGTSVGTLDTNLNNSSTGTIPALMNTLAPFGSTVYGAVQSVASNLRDADNGEYTISKALRDTTTSDTSVSNATYQQTQTISSNFTSINNNLGTVSDSGSTNTINGKINSIKASVGVSTDTTTATLFGYNKVLNDNIFSSGSSSAGDITTIKNNVNTIITRLGSSSSASGTIWGDVGSAKSDASTAVNRIGRSDTANSLWYDLLHNAGIKQITTSTETGSVYRNIYDVVTA